MNKNKPTKIQKEIEKLDNSYKYKHTILERVDKEGSSHHLFDYIEVRERLVMIFGEPETPEQHILLQKKH